MCKEADRPHRRHRPMYLAPTARTILHPPLIVPDMRDPWLLRGAMEQQQQQQHQEQRQPHPLQVPHGGFFSVVAPTAPPSYDSDSNSPSGQRSFGAATGGACSRWKDILIALWSCYHWLEDALLLVLVCLMGCFFYDVEVKVVKTDRQSQSHFMRLGVEGDVVRSGRVIIRTDGEDRRQPHGLPLYHSTNNGRRSTNTNNGPSRTPTEESRQEGLHYDASHESRSFGPSTRGSQLYQPTTV
jgi:hypothetical protein